MLFVKKIIPVFFICVYIITTTTAYKIPNVKLEILSDGFRVSIPDEPGIKYVAYNINRNRPFQSFEQGEYSAQVREPTNGRWEYQVKRTLADEDTISVWTSVQHDQLVYRNAAAELSVSDVKNNKDKPISTTTSTTTTTTRRPIIDNGNDECKPSITILQKRTVCQGELIFEETFDNGLDTINRWKQEVRLPLDNGDSEFVLYDTNAEVHDGALHIEPILWNEDKPGTDLKQGTLDLGARCTGNLNRLQECTREPGGVITNVLPPIISARINTKNSFSFKYGRVEIKAKLPQGDWLVPLLLLEPLTNHYGLNSYASGQIRIAFIRGNLNLSIRNGTYIDGRRLYGGAVLTPESQLREKSMVHLLRDVHFGADYHIYKMIWNDRELIFSIDGQEYGRIQGDFANKYSMESTNSNAWTSGEYMAPFDQEFFITLGLSVGGHGDFPDDSISNYNKKPWMNTSPKAAYKFWRDRSTWKTTWSNPSLKVDYVRVFAI